MELRQWRNKVIPNFEGMRTNANEAVVNAKSGKLSTMRSATGNLHGLSKDMDGIGWEWWEANSALWDNYVEHSNLAEQMGDNIYKTLAGYWRPGSILKESITGPVAEAELIIHLKPGETMD
mgnify:CR=1 FL=1